MTENSEVSPQSHLTTSKIHACNFKLINIIKSGFDFWTDNSVIHLHLLVSYSTLDLLADSVVLASCAIESCVHALQHGISSVFSVGADYRCLTESAQRWYKIWGLFSSSSRRDWQLLKCITNEVEENITWIVRYRGLLLFFDI